MPQQVDNTNYLTVLVDEFSSETEKKIIMVFDAVTRETHSLSSKLTEYPVETGSIISDHVIHNPITLEIEALVSNTPFQLLDVKAPEPISGSALYKNVPNNPPIQYTPSQFNVQQTPDQRSKLNASYYNDKDITEDRAKAAYELLKEKWQKAIPLKVITKLDVYPNMIITKINTVRDSKTTECWVTSCSLQQVLFTTSAVVDIKKVVKKKGIARNSKKKVDKGPCTTGQPINPLTGQPDLLLGAVDDTKRKAMSTWLTNP